MYLTDIGDSKVIGVDRIDKENNLMYGVVIFEGQNQGGSIRTITAKNGRWLPSLEQKVSESKTLIINRLLLEDGHIQEPVKDSPDNFSNIPFDKLIVNIVDEINYTITVYKGAREETTSEIAKDIKENELKSKTRDRQLRIEYHKRFSIPFAALGFVLIGLPFSIVSGRSGKSVSMGISVVIIIIYYMFYALGEGIGKNTQFNEALALWIPNIVFFVAGVFYIYRISRT